jgi:hypothetical protein
LSLLCKLGIHQEEGRGGLIGTFHYTIPIEVKVIETKQGFFCKRCEKELDLKVIEREVGNMSKENKKLALDLIDGYSSALNKL